MDRTSANEVARSRDNGMEVEQEAVLNTEWTRLESEAFHCTSPEPLLEMEWRRVEAEVEEDDDDEWGRTSTFRAGMS